MTVPPPATEMRGCRRSEPAAIRRLEMYKVDVTEPASLEHMPCTEPPSDTAKTL